MAMTRIAVRNLPLVPAGQPSVAKLTRNPLSGGEAMPSISHEAPLELLRGDPRLAAVLLRGLGVAIPGSADAAMAPSDLTASVPTELRADAVVMLSGADGGQLAVVVEIQLRYDARKRFSWPSYLTQVRATHRCPAVLVVICLSTTTASQCRAPIVTGHPGFDLVPLVIDSLSIPDPSGHSAATAGPELAVLAVLTGALDLAQDSARRLVLASLADLDESRLATYTVLVRSAASESARQALEDLMTTKFSDDFVDRFLAKGRSEGRAEGEAHMILRVLAARGVEVPDKVREQVLSCTDIGQLDVWVDRAATATSLEEVFGA